MVKAINREATLHGHKVCYAAAGERGPVVVLVHGIAGTSETWGPVLPLLGERHAVIAPDLLGHGQSGSGDGDYRWGPTRAACGICSLRLGTTA